MAIWVNEFYEVRLERLLKLAETVGKIFSEAGLEYRVAGGLATYFYVEEASPDAGRLTRDIDVVVRREDLEKIAKAAEPYGLRYRHVSGVETIPSPSRSLQRTGGSAASA